MSFEINRASNAHYTTDATIRGVINGFAGTFTMTLWMKRLAIAQHIWPFGAQKTTATTNLFRFRVTLAGVVDMRNEGGSVLASAGGELEDTNWHHILVRCDASSGDADMRIDDVEVGSLSGTWADGNDITLDPMIGATNRDGTSHRSVDGYMALLGFYPRILSASEATGLANGLHPDHYPDLALYWRMDFPTDGTVTPATQRDIITGQLAAKVGSGWHRANPTSPIFSAPRHDLYVQDVPAELMRMQTHRRRRITFPDAFAGDGGLPTRFLTEMRVDLVFKELGPHVYEVEWTSTVKPAAGPWWVVHNGVVREVHEPRYRFNDHPDTETQIEILTAETAPRHRHFSPEVVFRFDPVVGASHYRVERKISAVWKEVGTKREDGSGSYTFASGPLPEGLQEHRVISVDAEGNESTPVATTPKRIIRRPKPVMKDLTFDYAPGTQKVTVDKP